jgi:apolipoprotein N-acyltransferase
MARVMTAALASAIAVARRWPKAAALLLGAASATGFAPLGLWPVTLLALALLILLIGDAPTQRRAFGLGWAFGVGHFVVGLNWIATAFTYQAAMPAWLGWIAVALLSLYLALYPALAAWGAWAVSWRIAPAPRGATPTLGLAFAAMWIITEWLRSWVFTGFAWNPLAVIAVDIGSPASFLGTYGLSGLVIVAAGGVGRLLLWRPARGGAVADAAQRPLRDSGFWLFALLLFPAIILFGRALVPEMPRGDGAAITLVQPNVGQQDKWVGTKADANFAKLARLTVPNSPAPRLILWPEAAIPDYLETGYPWVYYQRSPAEARARLTKLMNPGDAILLGALKLEMDKAGEVVGARNAVMLVRPDGTLGPRYDKAHLVPYGEYLPMRPILSAIGLSRLAPGDLDFWPGPGPRTIDTGGFGKAGIQICYEIIFSGQVVDRANRPDFIFNPSNDAWFGSWGPPQHLAQARLRAIEEGLPVIRSTPTGISAVIDARGQILRSIPMGAAGRIDTRIPPAAAPTLFARHGNGCALAFAVLLLALAIASARRRG